MRPLALALLAGIAAVALAQPPSGKPEPEWRELFNGKDLAGWTPKIRGQKLGVNHLNTFRVADGLLQVRYDQYDTFDRQFGHLFADGTFSHYRLLVEYRFVGEQCKGGEGWATRNSGAMLHGQKPETMGLNQDFPVSIEAQLLGGLGKGKRSTNNVCSPGTNYVRNGKLVTQHCANSRSDTFDGDQWVTAEMEVRGAGAVTHFVNGKAVYEYEQAQYDPSDADAKKLAPAGGSLLISEGSISLQSESHPIDFRRVAIKLLPPGK